MRQLTIIVLLCLALTSAGCLSNDTATKPPLVVHTIEGYNVSFLFDESGYNISPRETTYGTGFEDDYYENGINISDPVNLKGVQVGIRKYIEPQEGGLDRSEIFMRMGSGLLGMQVQINRTVVDGHEGMIIFMPPQMVMGKSIPAVHVVEYYLDERTLVSFSTAGMEEAEFKALIDSLHAEREGSEVGRGS